MKLKFETLHQPAGKTRKSPMMAKRRKNSRRYVPRPISEALEERQLMSLTITLRGTDGSSSAVATSVGQVIHLELLATITSGDNRPSEDELNIVLGSIISSAAEGHAVAGNLAATVVAPFTALGVDNGTQQDLNGDGNIDVGSKNNNDPIGDLSARASPPAGTSNGTIVDNGTALQFEIATVTYTVTSLNDGGTTNINFVCNPIPFNAGYNALWFEEFQPCNNITNEVTNAPTVFQAGTPFTVSNPNLVVAPVAVNDTETVIRNTATSLNVLSNDDTVVALNDASLSIGTAPAHGTAVAQTNGEVLYTPTTGYTGSDSFTYTVDDNDGRVSNVATVSLNVVVPPPPVAAAVSTSVVENQSVTVPILSDVTATAPATVVPGSVTVQTAAAHGTAVPESNGSIIYTPTAGYIGTDTFTYTATDTNGETSNTATVTVMVSAPTPPSAVNDSSSTSAGAPVSINVLANDTTPQGTLNPASVTIVTPPTSGTAVVNTSNGTILYTPTPGYIGSDSFTYTVDDSFGDVSNPATVSLNVTAGIPPVANTFVAPVLTGQTSSINVLGNVSSGAPLVPGTVTIVTAPTNGTASVNTSTGAISYVPNANFVGTDTLTFTVGNENLDTSNPDTISIAVGTTISKAKGAAHSLSFTGATGGLETVTLSTGSAEVYFSGSNGTVTVSKAGKATVTGTGLQISSIALSGTTRASSLVIRGNAKTPLTVGAITDPTPLGSIVATNAILSGTTSVTTLNLNGLNSLSVGSITNGALVIGTGSKGSLRVTAGAVTNTALDSLAPISSIKVASWVGGGTTLTVTTSGSQTVINGGTTGITAPSLGTLTVAGELNSDLTLSATGRAAALGSARVTGAIAGGTWSIPGSIGSITAGSAASAWSPTLGNVGTLTIRSGGSASPITTGTISSLNITGDFTGSLTATSARSIRINGNINGASGSTAGDITFSGVLSQFVATGAITDSVITTGGNITSFTAGGLFASQLLAGVSSGTTLSTATSSTLGSSLIGTIRLTGKSGDQFTSSQILASKINSASLGSVTNATGGIAVRSINSFTGVFAGNAFRANKAALANESILAAAASQQGVTFGSFAITITG